LVIASALLALVPVAAGAQPAQTPDSTASQIRDTFLSLGYQASTPQLWWTNDRVTTFVVSDRGDQDNRQTRILMVLVYPDMATAQNEVEMAQAREATEGSTGHVGAGGPHLVPGYGPSVLRGNVAVVESTLQELAKRYAEESDSDRLAASWGYDPEAEKTTAAMYAVDADFLTALDTRIVSL
jgi:hypothetical protein